MQFSFSDTFAPTSDQIVIKAAVAKLCCQLDERMKFERFKGQTLQIELKMNHSSESESEVVIKKFTTKNYMDKYDQYYSLTC